MDALASNDEIRQVVREVLAEQFPNMKVIAVNIREDDNEDDVVKLSIVIEAEDNTFDPKRVPAFVRFAKERLSARREIRFPIFSFIARSELGKLSPEAA